MLRHAKPLQVDGGQDPGDDRVEPVAPYWTVHNLLLGGAADGECRMRLFRFLRQSLEAALERT